MVTLSTFEVFRQHFLCAEEDATDGELVFCDELIIFLLSDAPLEQGQVFDLDGVSWRLATRFGERWTAERV